jgi:hypothetical protein
MQAAIYPGNVLSLHMKKPPGFKYKSGMYLFVKCPDVSPFEWYQFILAAHMNQDTSYLRFLLTFDYDLAGIRSPSLLHQEMTT